MKWIVVISLVFVAQLASAQDSKNWVCEEGDYHLSMHILPGATSFNYDICEFSQCASQKLAHIAVRSSSEKPNVFLIAGPNSAEHLILSYGSDDNLNQVQRVSDSYVIQTFTNCKLN